MTIRNTILNIFFPAYCVECGKEGTELCRACLAKAPEAERECENWVFPIFDYRRKSVKDAVWLLKYKGKRGLAGIFAESLYGRILEELSDLSVMENFHDAILVPIPLSRARLRERGYNQAELICKELITLDRNVNFRLESGVLTKPKETTHQARIENRAERLRNIVGSFSARNVERIDGRNIILIDDVTTTGATLSEAKKILEQNGARKVIAFTVAH